MRGEWGYVHQNPRDGLRMSVSAGGNAVESPLMHAAGAPALLAVVATFRAAAFANRLARVEIDPARMDDLPRSFSGGMQQRLQVARTLVTHPALVFMDESTAGGLDVSVQARLLDLIRGLVADLAGLSVLLVTHDIAAARLLAGRILVMRRGGWWSRA